MGIYIHILSLALCCVWTVAQEVTIPVGLDGSDSVTIIRNYDAAGNYDVGYNENLLTGGASFHRERGYINGTRTGSYGYTTRNGLIRIVTYVADQNGYKAEVLTNEPGIVKEDPSDVDITKETEPDAEALARGPTGTGSPLQSSQSTVIYSSASDVVRNYVLAPVTSPEYASSAQVTVNAPYGTYQYRI